MTVDGGDAAPGERVEKEVGEFIASRDRERREGEKGNPDPWEESVRCYNAANAQAVLEDKLRHARGMCRSHTATFHVLIKKWDREISRLEALLGINRHARKKAS